MPKQVKKQVKKATVKRAPASKKPVKKVPKKTPPAVVAPPVVPVVTAQLPRHQSDVIWDEIKNLPIQMFGLPDQVVAMHVTPVPVEPSNLYVLIRSSATLPSLEAAIAPAFQVELVDKFVIIKRAPAPLIPKKR